MITRLCDSAVVCRRSIASVAICTAVWKPNVKSVPARSLSIVFGTPTTGIALVDQLARDAERVLAADRDQRVEPALLDRLAHLVDAALDLERVRPRRAEDRAAAVQDAARGLVGELDRLVLEHARPAVAEADELVVVLVDALADDAADDRVESGAVSAAGEDADAHSRGSKAKTAAARLAAGPGALLRLAQARASWCSCEIFGSQSSRLGRYQFQSPSSFMRRGAGRRARASRRSGRRPRGRRPSS